MEPNFDGQVAKFQAYNVFKQQMDFLSLYLNLPTIIHFTALSRYFNNILNNSTSDFGQKFWKTWAVRIGGIKLYKSKTINYKFKLVRKAMDDIKKNMKAFKLHRDNLEKEFPACHKCNRRCSRVCTNKHFDNVDGCYCNCKISIIKSDVRIIEDEIDYNKRKIVKKRRELYQQIYKLNEKLIVLDETKNKVQSYKRLDKIKTVLVNISKNDPKSSVRNQASKALLDYNKCKLKTSNVLKNPNYNASLKKLKNSNYTDEVKEHYCPNGQEHLWVTEGHDSVCEDCGRNHPIWCSHSECCWFCCNFKK